MLGLRQKISLGFFGLLVIVLVIVIQGILTSPARSVGRVILRRTIGASSLPANEGGVGEDG